MAKQWDNLNNINYATQIKFWVAYFDAIKKLPNGSYKVKEV